jgi:hypothetical protein
VQVVAAKKEHKRMQTTIGELMAMRDKRDRDTEEKKRMVATLEARVATLLKQVLAACPVPPVIQHSKTFAL